MTAQPSIELPDDIAQGDILAAAAGCFMERGYQGASIDDVARRLGATKGRIYHHYASKADLFAGVFRAGMALNRRTIAPYLAMEGPAIDRLIAMARAHTANMIASRPFQRTVWEGVTMQLRGATTPEQRAAFSELAEDRDSYSRLFRAAALAARDEGALDFDTPGIAIQMTFLALNSPIFWFQPRAGQSRAEIDRLVSEIVTFALRGLGYRGKIAP